MSYLPSLPEDAVLTDVFRAYPEAVGPLIDYHRIVLRGPSVFTLAERELIAAYVSGLNACRYCHGVHGATAVAFGLPEERLTALLTDLDTAPVEDRWKVLLRYLRTLTLTPARLSKADADAVLAAGWDEKALYDAVSVCALFNFMNRLVEGLGITADQPYFAAAARRFVEDPDYAGYGNAVTPPAGGAPRAAPPRPAV
ncbi:carboxymuconolactone decarboxylase family protein [Amycolatopsis samaneae]|uniref:Carboxymuconolactone decarboxylase family protein n=1 Tax=Amycolatopsis samaneae TaxID=664691 RepID=A0ABW5GRX0_9PSEU